MVTLNHCTAQQKLHTHSTKKEFELTIAPSVVIFLLILFIWICIITDVLNDNTRTDNFFRLIIGLKIEELLYPRLNWKFLSCTIISGLIAITYTFVLSQSRGKFVIYIGLFFVCSLCSFIFFISLYTIVTACLLPNDGTSNYVLLTLFFIFSLLIVTYLVVTVYCTLNVGTEAIFEIIRDSCRALKSYPIILIFASAVLAIIILILIFAVYVTKCLILTNSNDSLFWFYLVFNLYSTVAIINFFINVTQIVSSRYVIEWVWSKEPNWDSWTTQPNFRRTLKFDMGMATFFSIPLLSHVWSAHQSCRNRNSVNNVIKQYDFPTRLISQLGILTSVADFGMIQTSIYEYDSTTDLDGAPDLVLQINHELNLAVCGISNIIIVFGSFLISIPSILGNTYFCVFFLIIPFYIILTSAFRTLLVNKMLNDSTSKISKEERDGEQEFCTMNAEDQILYFR